MCDASDNELLADLLVTLDGDDYGPLELMEVERAVAPAPGPSQNFSCASSDVPTPSVGGATDTDAPLSPYAPSTDFAATLISALEPLTGVLYSETQLHDRGDYGGIVVEPPAIDLQDDTESETATTAAPSAPDVLPGKNYGPKHKSDPNKARKAQSEQIRALRSEVEELTERLSTLQAVSRRDGAGMETLQNKANAQAAGKRLDAPPVWESICHNQRTRRTEVEQDNSLLKRALDEQAQLVDDLQRALQRSSKALKSIDGYGISSRRMYALPSNSDTDAKIFDKLLAEADAAYYEVDGIFELNGMGAPRVEPWRGCWIRDGEHGRFADMFSCTVMPFSLEATAEVVWRFYTGPNKHCGPLYYKTAKTLGTSEDTIAEKLAIELVANGTHADFRVWQVLRRFVDADRVLVVWMGVLEPVEFANKPFASCAFHEKGCVACSRYRAGAETSAFTRLQRCHRIEPYVTPHSASAELSERDRSEIGAVINFVLSLDSISAHLEAFENELLKQSLRQLPPEQHR